MAVETAPVEVEVNIRHRLAGWVEEQLKMGDSLSDAVDTTIERVVAEGLSNEILKTLGHDIIRDNWRKFNREFRRQAGTGNRRFDPAVLNREDSLLESLWNIDGDYYRLGSMDKPLCAAAKGYFAQLADRQSQRMRFFAAIERALKKDECVADHFTHEQLQTVFEESIQEDD